MNGDAEEEVLDYEEEESDEGGPDAYGPALPPGVGAAASASPSSPPAAPETAAPTLGPALPPPPADEAQDVYGPVLPPPAGPTMAPTPAVVGPIGPALPPGMTQSDVLASSSGSESDGEAEEGPYVGPALPGPALPAGPALPPGMAASSSAKSSSEGEEEDSYGPALPPTADPAAEEGESENAYASRLHLLRTKEALKKHRNRREEWMTEAPKAVNAIGLGARTFSKASGRAKTEADASWTAGPEDRLLGAGGGGAGDAKEAAREAALSRRDEELAAKAAALSEGRAESLVDAHLKRSAEEAAEDGEGKRGRREFDRDRDVLGSAGRLRPSDVQQSVKQAALLNSRFGHGNSQKFL